MKSFAMCALMMMASGCGTTLVKVSDTAACNQPEWTQRASKTLPPLRDGTGGAALESYVGAAEEYHVLRERHEGLADCVEKNTRHE